MTTCTQSDRLSRAVAVFTFVIFCKSRIALEVCAGQIIEEHVEFHIEKILPAFRQVVEEGPLMFEQPVQALVEFMDLHQFKTCTQKVGHGACLIPVPVEPPFTPGIDETVTAKRLSDEIPTSPFAARRQLLCPEFVETELLVQRAGKPASTPLSGPAQFHVLEPNLRDVLVVDLNRTILGEKGHCFCPGGPIFEDFNRLAPCLALRTVYLSEVEHLSLDDPSTNHPAVLHHAPLPVLLTIFFAIRATQEHGTGRIPPSPQS